MAGSVFTPIGGRDQYHGGTFRAEDVVLTWTGITAFEGALVQEATWTCARQVSILYEIGSPAVYYVGNRRSGNATMRRVVGGRQTFAEMARVFGDICQPQDLIVDARQRGCSGALSPETASGLVGGGVKYTLKDATLNQLGGATQADQVIINENMAFVFIDMYYADSPAPA